MKHLRMTLIGLCFTSIIYAQQSPTNGVLSRFELVAGSSFSKNSGYLSNYDLKAGYSLGVGYSHPITKSFSLNMRTLFETKGSSASYRYGQVNIDNTTTELTDRHTVQFNYLSLYVLPTFQFGQKKNIYVSAGGYYSLLNKLSVNTQKSRTADGVLISDDTNTDKNYFSPGKFDAGVSFSIGYSFKIAERNQLLLQAFSNRGLVDLYNPAMGSQRNNTFGLMVSFRSR